MEVILTSVYIAGISAILSMIIYVTDKIVNNYGDVLIDINNQTKELTVKGGASLLSTLGEQRIFIPSACGGKGTCGACKVVVTSDIGPVMPTELPYLSPEELKISTRLACQVKLKTNVEIAIPDELFNIQQYSAKVKSIEQLTYDIREVRLALPEGTDITYKSGQYCQFEVPPYRKVKESTFRAYSMSSNPQDKENVEFIIRLVPEGVVTTYVHELLEMNQEINITGPFGDFHVRDTDAVMVCVAGGSGMAPFKSIFNDMLNQSTFTDREIWYFFGALTTKDMYYLDWLWDLDKKYENFHFVPALSKPQEGEQWNGEVGLITDVMDKYLKKEITGKREGYLCGSPGMLDACMDVMKKNDMDPEKIYFDKFA